MKIMQEFPIKVNTNKCGYEHSGWDGSITQELKIYARKVSEYQNYIQK